MEESARFFSSPRLRVPVLAPPPHPLPVRAWGACAEPPPEFWEVVAVEDGGLWVPVPALKCLVVVSLRLLFLVPTGVPVRSGDATFPKAMDNVTVRQGESATLR